MLKILEVNEASDIDIIAALARETWSRHYAPIIGQAQTDYMIEKFQSAFAIAEQIADGYRYYLVMDNGEKIGYFAIVPEPAERAALLSKIYVLPDRQGEGIGRRIIAFIEERCKAMGIDKLRLTVNKNNTGSVAFYLCMGFVNAGPLVQDIGGGFVMDDYKMVKTIGGK
ncbi:MAG: GNAT family N-acetyltransferase [Smithellaceae bacterium]|nr:GNAT family N-acetyltransferase [Smithellaceae bacterium]